MGILKVKTAISSENEVVSRTLKSTYLVDVSDIFNFFLLGEGEEGVRGGIGFLLKAPVGRGFLGGRGRGAGRVSAASWGIVLGGGGANFFFSGPKCPPSLNPRGA